MEAFSLGKDKHWHGASIIDDPDARTRSRAPMAYREGRLAARAGMSSRENPYIDYSPRERMEWRRGFFEELKSASIRGAKKELVRDDSNQD